MIGKIAKLKDPARHVFLGRYDDGTFLVEIKNLVGPREVRKTRMRLTDEALHALCLLYNDAGKGVAA
jgi:hypothetical protein